MNKRVDKLLTIARKATENVEYSSTTGISDDELIQYINDGQSRLMSKISEKHPMVFVKEAPLISVVKGQESYDLPDDTYLENRVTTVEYSDTELLKDLKIIKPASLHARRTSYEGYPNSYIRRSGAILLQPIPNSGGILRVNYQRKVADLDIRRGKVSAVTLNATDNSITSLTLDTLQNDYDADTIDNSDYITVVNRLGTQQMKRIPIDSVDADTGIITVDTSFTYLDSESIAVGDFVVTGYDATTHSELANNCERFLISYLIWKIFKRDSSEDAAEHIIELSSMEKDILASYSDPSDDIILIPMTNLEDV